MKPIKDKSFLDSNIIIYSIGADEVKKRIANDLLKQRPNISIQVLNEISNVMHRKLNVKIPEIKHVVDFLSRICTVKNITSKTIQSALDIMTSYGYSYYDSLIISCALENRCTALYSEDMNHGQ